MIVLDTSTLVAVLRDEPEAGRLRAAMNEAPLTMISAVNDFEARLLLRGRFGPGMVTRLDQFLDGLGTLVVPFNRHQGHLALQAFERFGKGQGHPAQLNMADCCAYALARARGLPLLFKGDDFARTDIPAVPY
ncbi:type II toxin-antitoxin system VapC family toxin [Aerophototrophica crusticola]|uniref:Ribonuclease VapC n=1 Tax=Aerophototrophica crusticola TaxID=1709002 RepID=A0A858R985_9PROT|nr:type II toxin-antitoxin system VapC family toxin [Rhodospirillaceae bacterium B3]